MAASDGHATLLLHRGEQTIQLSRRKGGKLAFPRARGLTQDPG